MGSIRRLSAVALALLILGSAACDDAVSPTMPTSAAPRASFTGSYTLVNSTEQSSVTVTQVMGSGGGTMSVNGHTLTVPAGALARPTRFTITTVAGSAIRVSLSAQDVRTGAPVTVFPSPLRLGLSYADAKSTKLSDFKVGWLLDGSIVAVQPTSLDRPHKQVVSWLYHFSEWAICN